MRSAAVLLLSCAASAFAYQVTAPTDTQGWTNQGAQTFTWTRVDTDAATFALFLTNTDRSALPVNNLELVAEVDGTKGSLSVNPPSGGWPTGHTFRLNLVKAANDTNTILAQSNDFNITASTSTSGTASGTTVIQTTNTGTTLIISTTGTSSGTSSGTTSAASGTSTDNTTAPGSNGATSVVGSAGLMAALALLGAVLA